MKSSPRFTIVFTDSGLGGLSSLAKFYRFLKNSSFLPFPEIDLIFFNAQQQNENSYSKMKDKSQKIKTFNGALEAIQGKYNPDIIAIACNTLSAIYPYTKFSKTGAHVIEIISSGKSQILRHINDFPNEPVLMFATQTTIKSAAYYFDNPLIFPISGENLASLIENDYQSSSVSNRVNEMFQRASELIGSKRTVSLFFGCTHYGYIKDLFYAIAKNFDLSIHKILDPESVFLEQLKTKIKIENTSFNTPHIKIAIESQAIIAINEIESIGSILQEDYPEISEILRNYTRLPNLF